jgi:hypothetical protein
MPQMKEVDKMSVDNLADTRLHLQKCTEQMLLK